MSSSPILNTAVEASLVLEQGLLVIPAQVGIQIAVLDSRLRGNNGTTKPGVDDAPDPVTLMFREQWSFFDHKVVKV